MTQHRGSLSSNGQRIQQAVVDKVQTEVQLQAQAQAQAQDTAQMYLLTDKHMGREMPEYESEARQRQNGNNMAKLNIINTLTSVA